MFKHCTKYKLAYNYGEKKLFILLVADISSIGIKYNSVFCFSCCSIFHLLGVVDWCVPKQKYINLSTKFYSHTCNLIQIKHYP